MKQIILVVIVLLGLSVFAETDIEFLGFEDNTKMIKFRQYNKGTNASYSVYYYLYFSNEGNISSIKFQAWYEPKYRDASVLDYTLFDYDKNSLTYHQSYKTTLKDRDVVNGITRESKNSKTSRYNFDTLTKNFRLGFNTAMLYSEDFREFFSDRYVKLLFVDGVNIDSGFGGGIEVRAWFENPLGKVLYDTKIPKNLYPTSYLLKKGKKQDRSYDDMNNTTKILLRDDTGSIKAKYEMEYYDDSIDSNNIKELRYYKEPNKIDKTMYFYSISEVSAQYQYFIDKGYAFKKVEGFDNIQDAFQLISLDEVEFGMKIVEITYHETGW